MELTRLDVLNIVVSREESEAVKTAAANLANDIRDVLGAEVHLVTEAQGKRITVRTLPDKDAKKESYTISVKGDELLICGSDRRGTIYGVYTLSEQLGVSPWYFFGDVPKKKKDRFVLPDGYSVTDAPEIEYRGIFINDEEELEHWVQTYMKEETIGVKTYEKIFEMLLRLKFNYIWPAMHVNSFNMKKENGALADKMGIVVGTSHCDMLMRSNNREWEPWLKQKGYEGAKYDFSIPGRNKEILTEYWRESVQQNKDFEVSYTLGMRGVHDSGFNVESLKGLEGKELLEAKINLLQEVISVQENLLAEEVSGEPLKIFVPYKEVLELYDNGLKVPENLTLIWVNDNYGYVRRYPSEQERQRKGGNGLYYHNSYWAPPGNSYMFICSIPLAHTKNELKKSYAEGIRKLWVTNFGAMKPLEMQMNFFADYAWEAGKEKKTADVVKWTEQWLGRNFTGLDCGKLAEILTEFDQLTNTRKIEHLEEGAFSLVAYGDQGAARLKRYEQMFADANLMYEMLPDNEKDAFFQLVLMKIHAAYYSNAMFYYSDRSHLCSMQGKSSAAQKYTIMSLKFDRLRRQMLYYYNHIMAGGKWNNILTPEDFPPPRTAMYPPCMPPLFKEKKKLIVTTWGGSLNLNFVNHKSKWLEVANAGEGDLAYEINAPEWVILSRRKGIVKSEERIAVRVTADDDCSGFINIISPETGESFRVMVSYKSGEEFDDGRLVVEADAYQYKSIGAEIIPCLGRDHGNVVQLMHEGATVTYNFETPEEGDYTLVIHRFPTLNSVGRIRCGVTLDDKAPEVYEADVRDEHQGLWKANVQSNVDDTILMPLHMDRGKHSLTITGIDKYFAYSRFILYLGERKKDIPGLVCYDNPLPSDVDTESLGKRLYGDISLEPRREIFTRRDAGHNANTDYDEYRPGKSEVSFDEWTEKSFETISEILEAGEKIFTEVNGTVKIPAASALIGTEYASVEERGKDKVIHCNSTSYGGTGIALYVREKGPNFTLEEAPVLRYAFETKEFSRKTLWMRLYMWDKYESYFELTLDGVHYTSKDFVKPGIWCYSAENTWRNDQVIDVDLPAGKHELKIHLISRGLRVDQIVLTDKEIDEWNS